jgi:ATP-dependent Clp protease ATP-binding subunit ClpX
MKVGLFKSRTWPVLCVLSTVCIYLHITRWINIHCLQETLLLDPMFEIPGSDVMSVHITEDVVNGMSPPVYIRGKPVSQDEEEQTIEVQARAKVK